MGPSQRAQRSHESSNHRMIAVAAQGPRVDFIRIRQDCNLSPGQSYIYT